MNLIYLAQQNPNFYAPPVPLPEPALPQYHLPFIDGLINYFNSYEWVRLHFTLELLGVFLILIFLILLVIIELKDKLLFRSWQWKLKNLTDPVVLPKDEIQKNRELIDKYLLKGDQKSLREAVLIADEILHRTLDIMGYSGNVIEQLKFVPHEILPNLIDLERVHIIVEGYKANPDFILDRKQIEEIIRVYNESFKNLGLDAIQ